MENEHTDLIQSARDRLNAEQEEIERRRKSADERVREGNMAKPELIPATIKAGVMNSGKILRVAAYCRVSTDMVEQETSYELQKDHFEKMIRLRPDWKLAGIYADKGKSGTNIMHRESFLKLIEDCYAGKIDLIVTRAVSRFARNLLDCLNYVRKLKTIGVEVYFEQENLRTLDGTSEMILTVLSMVAQEESHIKSEAMNSSVEIRFGLGMFLTPKLIGYDHVGPGELQMNYSESLTVRKMYYMLLNGYTPTEIANELMRLERPTKIGRLKWTSNTVIAVLKNERYCGDVLARKTYTPDYLTHKSKINHGEKNQYFKADHHEAIIPRDLWNAAQRILRSLKYQHSGAYIPMTVIERGILQGYISMNRNWAGHQLDEYFAVCRNALGAQGSYKGDLEEYKNNSTNAEGGNEKMNIVEVPMDRYQVARCDLFSHHNDPRMHIDCNKMHFNNACIRMLGANGETPATIELLLNPVRRMIAVRTCSNEHPNSIAWIDGTGKARTIGCTNFSKMLYELLGFDNTYSYDFPAQLQTNGDERILFFDLDEYSGTLRSITRKLEQEKEDLKNADGAASDTGGKEEKPLEIRSGADYSRGGRFGDYYEIHLQYLKKKPSGEWNIRDHGHVLSDSFRITEEEMRRLDEEIRAVSIAEEQLIKEQNGPKSMTEDEAHRVLEEKDGVQLYNKGTETGGQAHKGSKDPEDIQ